jgi:adenosine deaminase
MVFEWQKQPWALGCSAEALEFSQKSPKGFKESSLEFGFSLFSKRKMELHVHLEAAVPGCFYEKLNERAGNRHRVEDLPSARAPFPNFVSFIRGWVDNTLLFQNVSDFADLVEAFVQERMRMNILYSDVHVSPGDFSYLRKRFSPNAQPQFEFEDVLKAYLRGLKKCALLYPRCYVRLVVDLVWISEKAELEKSGAVLKAVWSSEENRDPRGGRFCVGIGLGGPETPSNRETLASEIESLRTQGWKLDIHTGEMLSAEEQLKSVQMFAPDRVSHGLASAVRGEAPSVFTVFCPISNIRTGCFQKRLKDYPLNAYREGSWSLGSDDPLLFKNNMVFDWVCLEEEFGNAPELYEECESHQWGGCFDLDAARNALRA